MAMIFGFKLQNYRDLRDISLGRLWNRQEVDELTPLVAVMKKPGIHDTIRKGRRLL